MDCPGAVGIEIACARAGEGIVGNDRRICHPAIVLPGKPLFFVLIIHVDGAIEKLGKFHAPTGTAFDRIIRL